MRDAKGGGVSYRPSFCAIRRLDSSSEKKAAFLCKSHVADETEKVAGLGLVNVFDAKTLYPIALSSDLLLVRNDQEAACLRLKLKASKSAP